MSEYAKRIPKNRHLTLDRIIQDQGYYDIDGNWNSILTFDEYPGKLFRGRVEVFIFNRKHDVYIDLHNGLYRIPGGSIERNRSYKYQVSMEAKEEARIILGDITSTGYSYIRLFKKKYYDGKIQWDGVYNKVYIADFKSWYYGPINKTVRDDHMVKYGQFIQFEEVAKLLTVNHQKALNLIPR